MLATENCNACQVCFEEVKHRLELKSLKTGNGDVLRSEDCGHLICRTCMASYVVARVEEQRVFGVRCPAIGCKNELYEHDVRRLVECGDLAQDVHDRFAEIRSRDYTARAKDLTDVMCQDDYELLRCVWETTRSCPRCKLVIEKSQGCNSFYCICGHHFDYQQAPRAVGNGCKSFGRVISLAENLRISVNEAEQFGGDSKLYFKSGRTAAALGVTREEACEIHKQAHSGDEGARERIRLSRT